MTSLGFINFNYNNNHTFFDPESQEKVKSSQEFSVPEYEEIDFSTGTLDLSDFENSVLNEEASDEEGYESGNEIIIDIENLDLEAQTNIRETAEKAGFFLCNLKTQDSLLKAISNASKLTGHKKAVEISKKLREGVKYVSSWKSVKEGKVHYTHLDPSNLVESHKTRKTISSSTFTIYGLVSDSLSLIQAASNQIDAESSASMALAQAVPIVAVPIGTLKLANKLISFDSAIRERLNVKEGEDVTIKNVVLLRSGVEATREAVKMGIVLTGLANPVVLTGLAVAGVATGALGLYLNYQETTAKTKVQKIC